MPQLTHDTAMFRFSVIAPLLAPDPQRTLKSRIKAEAEKLRQFPSGKVDIVGYGTIEKWLYAYRHGGLEELATAPRKDAGSHRVVGDELALTIEALVGSHPALKSAALIRQLRKDGHLDGPNVPSTSTLYRFIKSLRRGPPDAPNRPRAAFETPYAGYLWQADIMYGPHLPQRQSNGRSRRSQTYLIGIVDDHSRLFCHGEFRFKQDLGAWLSVLQTAIEKRGIPFRLYCDNGKVFRSEQLRTIAARLGMNVSYTRVRDAAAKGKIERLFGTVRTAFLEPLMLLEPPGCIHTLNQRFLAWMETDYNQAPHSVLEVSPLHRWMESSQHVRSLPGDHDRLFWCEVTRTVRKDATFSFQSRTYETDPALAGRKVTVCYDLNDPIGDVFVVWDDRCFGRANLLNRSDNHNKPRF